MLVQMLPRNFPCLLPVLQVQLGAQRLRMNPVTSHCPSRKDWTNCLKDWKEEMLSGCKTSVKLSSLLIGKLVPDCAVDMPATPWMICFRIRGKFDQELSVKVTSSRTENNVLISFPTEKKGPWNKQTRRVWRGGLGCFLLLLRRMRRHTKCTKLVPWSTGWVLDFSLGCEWVHIRTWTRWISTVA